jgi:putative salt-induced outer membrane protein YdiY
MRTAAQCILAGILATATGAAAWADSVVMNNGDKLTGAIEEVNPSTVIITSPYAGRLQIDRVAIKTMQSDKAVTIVRPSNTREQLFLSPAADGKGWQETTAYVAPPPPPAPPAPVAAAPVRHTSLLDLGPDWKNQLAIGAMNTSGNDETTTFRGDISLKYDHKPDELTIKFTGAYGISNGDQNQGLFAETAVYRHDITNKLYAFLDDDIRYDAVKGISLQAQGHGGLGYWLYRTDKVKLDVRGGPGVTYLKTFDGREDTSPSAEAGVRFEYVFSERVNFTQEATYSTSLTDLDIWRIHSETALNFKLDLERGLGLKLAFDDDYENQPSVGRRNNDTRLSVALTLDF